MQLAKKLHLHPGSTITIEIENGKLVVQSPKYDLDTILNEITPKNRHHILLEDEQTGVEEW